MINVAVDIGASSGRVMIGELKNDDLTIHEIHRFSNGFTEKKGTLFWDIDHLLKEILIGLQKVKKMRYKNCTVGIDTWAVDYALIDKEGNRIKEVVSYRDGRTDHTIEKLAKSISKEDIYHITGIQFLPFNTLYQLYEEDEEILRKVNKILMVPDYLNYRLTGKMWMETTNASTTQLFDGKTRKLSDRLLGKVNLSRDHFAPLTDPGNILGELKKDQFPDFDLPTCQIVNVASHDTASAVVGTPGDDQENWAYLSSGTWSLLGIETKKPIINEQSRRANYTNEWGAFQTYRFLKNIMGLWVIQEVRRHLPQQYDYAELVEMAGSVKPFQQFINLNDERFLNPKNMVKEIQNYCRETGQKVPKTPGEIAAAVFYNLAIIYAIEIEELEAITHEEINHLYIVGGGGQNHLLNQLTANLSQKSVFIGPSEATAIGNILMQLITLEKVTNLAEGRKLIRKSFGVQEYSPEPIDHQNIKDQFKKICN